MTVNVRRAADQRFMWDYCSARIHHWYDSQTELQGLQIEIERNFLDEFFSLALKYTVVVKRRGRTNVHTIRGQARNPRHNQATAPKMMFRLAEYLQRQKNGPRVLRPLDYCAPANLFLYEDAPGIPVDAGLRHSRQSTTPMLTAEIVRLFPVIARLVRRLHTVTTPPWLPRHTSLDYTREVRGFLRLMAEHTPKTAAAASQVWQTLLRSQSQLLKRLTAPGRATILHGDLHLGNVILNQKQVTLIDLSDASAGHPMFDIARLGVQTRHLVRLNRRRDLEPILSGLLRAFTHQYFNNQVSLLDRQAFHFWSSFHLLQMMSIYSFAANPSERVVLLEEFMNGLQFHADALVTPEPMLKLI